MLQGEAHRNLLTWGVTAWYPLRQCVGDLYRATLQQWWESEVWSNWNVAKSSPTAINWCPTTNPDSMTLFRTLKFILRTTRRQWNRCKEEEMGTDLHFWTITLDDIWRISQNRGRMELGGRRQKGLQSRQEVMWCRKPHQIQMVFLCDNRNRAMQRYRRRPSRKGIRGA